MIAACMTAAAMLPAFLCNPSAPPPLPPPIPAVWRDLAVCESGMGGDPRWSYDGPSGFDGGLQFLPSTWRAFKSDHHPPYAWQAPPSEQTEVARRVLDRQGVGAWPTCGPRVGLSRSDANREEAP